jgi:CHAT domain-containing protein
LEFKELTSDTTNALLHGSKGRLGLLNQKVAGDSDILARTLQTIHAALESTLISPLETWLTSKQLNRAVLVPLGSLGLLPLHIAASGDVAFSYAPSARALAVAASNARRSLRGNAVVVANPQRADDRPLPFAVAEARSIRQILQDSGPVRTMVGTEATLANIRTATQTRPAVVHFACHARFRPADPLASHLLLAGDDQLSLADVFSRQADLSSARVVSLSACQSGNVEFRRAPDESFGFPSALMCTGIPGIVSTLWPVDDAAAALFSVRMYQLMVGDNVEPVEAVARARTWLRLGTAAEFAEFISTQRSTLDSADENADAALSLLWRDLALGEPTWRPYESPVHWAAFVLTGV